MRPENRGRVGPEDVVLAAHPGSGASWIGTLLVNLGICYLSGEDELLAEGGGQRSQGLVDDRGRPLPGAGPSHGSGHRVRPLWEHLPTLRDRGARPAGWREACRVVKTNQSALVWSPPGRVLLLVRDGRDTLLSLYHHLAQFSDLEVSLLDFLTGNGGAWSPPPASWAVCCLSWLGVPRERLHVLKFETCKARPRESFAAMLDFLEIRRTREELEAAIDASSYDAMRRQESAALEAQGLGVGVGRIMRRGLVGEWREVYTEPMLAAFAGMPRRALRELGYPVEAIPDRPPRRAPEVS